MKTGSVPDDSADYWEERKSIDKWIKDLKDSVSKLETAEDSFKTKDAKFRELQGDYKKSMSNLESLKKLKDIVAELKQEVGELLEGVYDVQDVVTATQKEMGDCQIPVNIKVRAKEIEQLSHKLDNIIDEFNDLKQTDEEFEGSNESEKEIKLLIEQIGRKLKGFEQERADHKSYQRTKMERYSEKDIFSETNAAIIVDVRQFKDKIQDTNNRLKNLEEMMADLNNKLIMQDMANATKIMENKAKDLRERLKLVDEEIKKINKTGTEMDGNTSTNEEEEFIEALKEEMPELFKNIDGHFDQLDKVDAMVKEL